MAQSGSTNRLGPGQSSLGQDVHLCASCATIAHSPEIRLTCINAHPSLLLLLFPLCFLSLYLFVLSPTFCVDASLVTFFGLTNNQTGQQLHKTDVNQSGEIDVKDFELAIEVSAGAGRMRRGVIGAETGAEIKTKTKTNVGRNACNEIQQMPLINMQSDDVYRPEAESLKTTTKASATTTKVTTEVRITTMETNCNNVPWHFFGTGVDFAWNSRANAECLLAFRVACIADKILCKREVI